MSNVDNPKMKYEYTRYILRLCSCWDDCKMQPQFLQHVTFDSLELKVNSSQRKHQTFSWSHIGNHLLARLAPLCSFPVWDLEVFGELPNLLMVTYWQSPPSPTCTSLQFSDVGFGIVLGAANKFLRDVYCCASFGTDLLVVTYCLHWLILVHQCDSPSQPHLPMFVYIPKQLHGRRFLTLA